MSLGDTLQELRLDKGLKQKDIGALLGLAESTISHYELDISTPDITSLNKLADFYNTTIDYLLGRTTAKTSYKDLEKAFKTQHGEYTIKEVVDKFLSISAGNQTTIVELIIALEDFEQRKFQTNRHTIRK